ncbi:beta strand repeat-containing protein [Falsiruegeria mediterranea]
MTTDGVFKLSDIDGSNGFVIEGVNVADTAGRAVSYAGDVNGDGIDDLIIGAESADPGGDKNAGESYVVFGSAAGFGATLPLSSLNGSNGFAIQGFHSYDRVGVDVSSAGDVNGDGFDDLIIGTFLGSRPTTSESYVVFGSASAFEPTLLTSSLNGSNGFMIQGVDQVRANATSVSSAGDVNGDGIDDLIIGESFVSFGDQYYAGESYVVFGSTAGFAATLPLSTLDGSNGFAIPGANGSDNVGRSVSSAGDVNGDGIDDLIIGASGESYVVFGSTAGFAATLPVSSLDGSNGFAIQGSSSSVSSAGDINGDGIDDLIIGATGASPGGIGNAGEIYVVFGSTSGFAATLPVSSLDGSNGFVIQGESPNQRIGNAVSSAGDFNGDGIDDLIFGAKDADPDGITDAGESYVVYGSTAGFAATLPLSSLDGSNGFVIQGEIEKYYSGYSVSFAGDINGDGGDDLIIGAPGDEYSHPGNSYVIFGKVRIPVGPDITGTDGNDTIAGTENSERIFGLGGSDWIMPMAGLDTVDGGDGFDQISFDTATAAIIASLKDGVAVAGDQANALVNVEGITGSSYADALRGDDANNKLRGLGGADTFFTDGGADTIEGGAGTDLLIAGDFVSGAADIRLSLMAGRGWTGAAEGDHYSGIENVSSGWGNDELTGDHEDNHLSGGYGNDTLMGNGGRDTLDGGHGIDVVQFAYDRDKYLITQNGDQTIVDYIDKPGAFDGPNVVIHAEVFRFADGDVDPYNLFGTPGDDMMTWDPAHQTLRNVDGLAGFDTFSFQDANDGVRGNLADKTVFVSELGRSIVLESIEGITGSSYVDELRGDDNDNKLRGLGGADTFYTDIGADTIEGGAGIDLLIAGGFYENAADISLSLLAGRGWTGAAKGDHYSGIENVSSGWGDDSLTGDHGDNHLNGGYGDDFLIGAGGNDTLDGGFGTDIVLFAYDRREYTITNDGFRTTVDYIGPGTGDGTNIVIHSEILRFADGDLIL